MFKLNQQLSQLRSLPPQRKAIVAGALLVLFALSLLVSQRLLRSQFSLTPPPRLFLPTASPAPKPTSVLRLVPATAELEVGKGQQIEVILEKVAADALDIVLTFDPEEVTVNKLTPGEGYPSYPVLKLEKDKIKISAAVTPDNSTPPLLPVTIASFYLTAKKVGAPTAIVDFVPLETIVAVDGETKLGVTVGGAYTSN